MNWLKSHGQGVQNEAHPKVSSGRAAMNHIYGALVSPLAELSERLNWGALIIIGFILTYALCYNIWSTFAFPFYLDYLHYTKDQVAFASKVFGIFMTMIGISLGRVFVQHASAASQPSSSAPRSLLSAIFSMPISPRVAATSTRSPMGSG